MSRPRLEQWLGPRSGRKSIADHIAFSLTTNCIHRDGAAVLMGSIRQLCGEFGGPGKEAKALLEELA
jgi:hypothetical protein